MEINFIIEQLMQQFAIWMPSIASILGTILVLVNSREKFKGAIDDMKAASVELKNDKSIKELIETIKEQSATIKQQSVENETLKRQNRLILEQLTKIKNYDVIKSAYAEVPNESSNKKIQESEK